ncbi:MAG: hypothetical protein AABW93_03060, partial [Nanoarchaeota archaeon]
MTSSGGVSATTGSFSGAGDSYFIGKLGIGTTAPTELLHIEKSQDANTGVRIYNDNVGASATAGITLQQRDTGNVGVWTTYLRMKSDKKFYITNNSNNVVVDTNGNVGIGTTGPNVVG